MLLADYPLYASGDELSLRLDNFQTKNKSCERRAYGRAGPLIRSVAPAGIIDASDCSDRDSNRKSASTEMSSGRSATSEVEDHRPNHAWLAPGPVRWSSIMRIRAAAYGVAGVRSITIRTMFALNEICIKRMVDT